MKTTAQVLGRNNRLVWMKIPDAWENIILTMPESVLIHGTRTADEVRVEVDPDSLYTEGPHYRAKVKVLGKSARKAGTR